MANTTLVRTKTRLESKRTTEPLHCMPKLLAMGFVALVNELSDFSEANYENTNNACNSSQTIEPLYCMYF